MFNPEDTEWLNGYVNKTHLYARQDTLQISHRLKVKQQKSYSHANGDQRES